MMFIEMEMKFQSHSLYILHSVNTNKYCIFLCQRLIKKTNKLSFPREVVFGLPENWQWD